MECAPPVDISQIQFCGWPLEPATALHGLQELIHITIMANSRQGGAFGFLRKSIGSVTYSTIKDGKGKRIQVARSKPVEVANPNTVAQILQRMKVKPAARFYSAFVEILSNAFEGITYGPASRRRFMQLAMSQTGPYIPKGATRFLPAKYPVAEGSLVAMTSFGYGTVENISSAAYGKKGFFGYLVSGEQDDATFAQFAQEFFGGDVQVTALIVTQSADGSFVPHYGRFLTSDIPATVDGRVYLFNFGDGSGVLAQADQLYLLAGSTLPATGESSIDPNAIDPLFTSVVAGAIIISRKDGDNWLRSNATMVVNDALEVNLYGQEAMGAAIESFQSAQGVNSLNSSWYLNLANGQPFYGQLRNMNYTLEFEGADSTVIQRDVVIPIGYVVNEYGALSSQIPADADGNLIVFANGSYTNMADPSEGAAADAKVKVSDVYLQITGMPTTYLWKEAYAIQIQA